MENADSENKDSIKQNDFIEIEYTGYVNGKPFDSNISEDLEKISAQAKPQKTVVIVGQKMVVPGLDKEFVGKKTGHEYKINISYKEGFGERKKEFVKTIPLKVFTNQKVNPIPGATLLLDNSLAKVITISGARVIVDFNSPLAGKDLEYKFTIKRKVSDSKEKAEAFFQYFLRFSPEFENTNQQVIVKGPKILEKVVENIKGKFKELVGVSLSFKEVNKKTDLKKDADASD